MSSIVMADNSETVTITEESDKSNLKENNTDGYKVRFSKLI